MRYLFLIPLIIILIFGCKKSKTTDPKKEYVKALVILAEESNCGYLLDIDNILYYPQNLPEKYNQWSGIPEDNTIFIQYKLSNISDSLRCFSNITQQNISFRKLTILKILE